MARMTMTRSERYVLSSQVFKLANVDMLRQVLRAYKELNNSQISWFFFNQETSPRYNDIYEQFPIDGTCGFQRTYVVILGRWLFDKKHGTK